jgi:NADPH:quinone reductase-like Zn-dependent oxidoreductase
MEPLGVHPVMFRVKAVVVRRYGSPDVLELTDIPAPVPADDEVLVRIHSSSVCFGDWLIRSGATMARLLNGFTKPRIRVLGVDLAGTVESVGNRVTRFAPGDHVYGSRGDKFGAHAEFACVAETGFLAHKPVNMTFEEAGSVFVGGACALYFLRKAAIKPGERVLIHGASGSLGVFAVQLAKYYGAHVTGVCGPSNVELVKSLGADDVIDYTTRDFANGDVPYDVIFDILGKGGFPRGLRVLVPGGRYLLVGFSGGVLAIAAALLRGAWAHARGAARFVTGAAAPVSADLVFLKELIEAGKLRNVIGRTYSLSEIAEAHRYAQSGHKVGNVAVVVADPALQAIDTRSA